MKFKVNDRVRYLPEGIFKGFLGQIQQIHTDLPEQVLVRFDNTANTYWCQEHHLALVENTNMNTFKLGDSVTHRCVNEGKVIGNVDKIREQAGDNIHVKFKNGKEHWCAPSNLTLVSAENKNDFKYQIGEKVEVQYNNIKLEVIIVQQFKHPKTNQNCYIIDTKGHYLFEIKGEKCSTNLFNFAEIYLFPIKPEIKLGDYTVEFGENKIKVGCTEVTKEQIKEILARME